MEKKEGHWCKKKSTSYGIAAEKWFIFVFVFSMKQWKVIQDTSIRLLGTMTLTIIYNVNVISCLEKQLYILFRSFFFC